MLLSIRNAFLSLTVDTLGAQMMSLRSGGMEYLWQGGREYWADRAPTLFPFIGRLTENRCMFHGKSYSMGIHGFAAQSEFLPLEQSPESLVLCLTASAATRAQYPFDFSLKISYCLKENVLEITYSVYNASDCVMPFGIGGHPGFRVPFSDSDCFEDYVLDFSQECRPDRVGFTPAVYLSGRDEPFPLEGGRRLRLRHDLFDEDAIILKNMDRRVKLHSVKGNRFLTVSFPQMPYLGIWHVPGTDAPYVCIEPWSSLPSRQDIVEELSCKSDLIHLLPRQTYENKWTITIANKEDSHD